MHVEPHPNQTLPHTESVEPRRERLRRHGHRILLYTWAFALVSGPGERVAPTSVSSRLPM